MSRSATGSLNVRKLINRLCEKADGVFLWISLALKSLTQGLAKFDTPSETFERLDQMSGSLNDLFRDMLADIDYIHRPRVARILRLTGDRVNEANRETYNGNKPMTLLELASALDWFAWDTAGHLNQQDVWKTPSPSRLGATVEALRELADLCLTQSAGLLDCVPVERDLLDKPPVGQSFSLYMGMEVRYIHRTVHEFLQTENAARELLSECLLPGRELDVVVTRGQSRLAFMFAALAAKYASNNQPNHKRIITECISEAQKQFRMSISRFAAIENARLKFDEDHMQELEERYTAFFAFAKSVVGSGGQLRPEKSGSELIVVLAQPHRSDEYFILTAAENGLRSWIIAKLTRSPPREQHSLVHRLLCASIIGMLRRNSFDNPLPSAFSPNKYYGDLVLEFMQHDGFGPNFSVPKSFSILERPIHALLPYTYALHRGARPTLWVFLMTAFLCYYPNLAGPYVHDHGQWDLRPFLKRPQHRDLHWPQNLLEPFLLAIARGADLNHEVQYTSFFPEHEGGLVWAVSISSSPLLLLEQTRRSTRHHQADGIKLDMMIANAFAAGFESTSTVLAVVSCTDKTRPDRALPPDCWNHDRIDDENLQKSLAKACGELDAIEYFFHQTEMRMNQFFRSLRAAPHCYLGVFVNAGDRIAERPAPFDPVCCKYYDIRVQQDLHQLA